MHPQCATVWCGFLLEDTGQFFIENAAGQKITVNVLRYEDGGHVVSTTPKQFNESFPVHGIFRFGDQNWTPGSLDLTPFSF